MRTMLKPGIIVDIILSELFKLNLVYENSILFEPYGFLSEIISENSIIKSSDSVYLYLSKQAIFE